MFGLINASFQEDFWTSEKFLRKLREIKASQIDYNFVTMTQASSTLIADTTKAPATTVI